MTTDWDIVKRSLRIEEALEALGIPVARRDGPELWASCPLPSHGGRDANPSFSVNIQKRAYYCFGCGGGDLAHLVVALRGGTRSEAVSYLSTYSDARNPDSEYYMKLLKALLEPKPRKTFVREPVLPSFPPERLEEWPYAYEYCRSRGISDEVTEQLGIRFAEQATRKTYTGPAIIVPHVFRRRLVGWQERWLDYGKPGFPERMPKYTNTSDFPKKETLYNFDPAADRESTGVFVVESVFTVAKLMTAGFMGVATFGAAVNRSQLDLLRMLHLPVIVSYDNDKVGQNATNLVVHALYNDVHVEVLDPPEGEKADLGDLSVEELQEHATKRYSYITYLTEH